MNNHRLTKEQIADLLNDLPPEHIVCKMLEAMEKEDPNGFRIMAGELFRDSIQALREEHLSWESQLADTLTDWIATLELYINPDYPHIKKAIEESSGAEAISTFNLLKQE